jgi:hypothetical protein
MINAHKIHGRVDGHVTSVAGRYASRREHGEPRQDTARTTRAHRAARREQGSGAAPGASRIARAARPLQGPRLHGQGRARRGRYTAPGERVGAAVPGRGSAPGSGAGGWGRGRAGHALAARHGRASAPPRGEGGSRGGRKRGRAHRGRALGGTGRARRAGATEAGSRHGRGKLRGGSAPWPR